MTLANALTYARVACAPAVLAAAVAGHVPLYASLFALALLTDALDGPVARQQGTASAHGARLDSLADLLLYLAVFVGAVVAFPMLTEELPGTMLLLVTSFMLPPLAGFWRYRRLPAFHTRLCRVAAVAIAAAFVALVAASLTWPLQLAAAVLALSAVEELAITAVLAEWTPDVPHLRHAVALRDGRRGHHATSPSHPVLP